MPALKARLGREYDPTHVKDVDQVSAIQHERFYSNPPADSELPKPSVPPLLPQVPTASFLAEQAAEQRREAKLAHLRDTNAMMRQFLQKADPQLQPAPSTKLVGQASSLPVPPKPGSRRNEEANS